MSTKVPGLKPRNGVWETRVQIPTGVRLSYGKTVEQVSHGTRDFNTALAKHGPLMAQIKRRIDSIRSGQLTLPEPEQAAPVLWSPDDAHAAIQRWAKAETDRAYLEHFHENAPVEPPLSDEAMARGERILALRERRYPDIAGFDEALAAAISDQLPITPSHPTIPKLRGWFADAWLTVENRIAEFRHDNYSGWSLKAAVEPTARPQAGTASDIGPMPGNGSMALSEVMEAFIAQTQPNPKDESEIRGYMRRLIEHLGDIPISDVTTLKLDSFLIQLRKFPFTKNPAINKLPFNAIVDRYGDVGDMPKLANKTIRSKWFGAYNRIAKWALDRKLISENPVRAAMPKKADDVETPRDDWTPEQIERMFATPMYKGAASLVGNRDEPGKFVAKDAKYWLPLVGLWTGMRLDEIGTLSRDELKKHEEGMWYFDLTNRTLKGPRRVKNKKSARLIPLHNKLIDLGFIEYAAKQTEWVFPDLPHDGKRPGDTTAQFSKWFGRWKRANGLVDPTKKQDFHSLRHSWKTRARRAFLAEDVHDALDGHAGSANQQVSRNYGEDDVPFLSERMNQIKFPTFKLKA